MTQPNPFGNEASVRELIERIRGADYDGLQPTEMRAHLDALKIVSEATITRYETVTNLEKTLREKLTLADIREGISEVLVLTREGNHLKNPLYLDELEMTPPYRVPRAWKQLDAHLIDHRGRPIKKPSAWRQIWDWLWL